MRKHLKVKVFGGFSAVDEFHLSALLKTIINITQSASVWGQHTHSLLRFVGSGFIMWAQAQATRS